MHTQFIYYAYRGYGCHPHSYVLSAYSSLTLTLIAAVAIVPVAAGAATAVALVLLALIDCTAAPP